MEREPDESKKDTHLPVREIVLVGVKMPFWDIVNLMVKFGIAAIPAAIVLSIIGFFVFVAGGSFLGGFLGGLRH